ncbi:MAG: ThiF family adenylyltransferase [Candidatus Aenigmatarchaeota archaeon]
MNKRYLRQEKFIGNINKLKKINVAIIGAGSIGSFLAEYLLRAGFERLKIIDRDFVEIENLCCQNYTERDLGLPKALCLGKKLQSINKKAKIEYIVDDLNYKNIESFLFGINIIFDATDNMLTRFLLNDYCVKHKIPWFYTAILKDIGYSHLFLPGNACLRCFIKNPILTETCESSGILSTLPPFISSMQVSKVLNYIFYNKKSSDFIIFNALETSIKKFKVKKDKNCLCCVKKKFEYLNGKDYEISKICGKNIFQLKIEQKIDFSIFKNLEKIGKVIQNNHIFHFIKNNVNVSLFKNGRIIIKGVKNEKDAKKIIAKYFGFT